MQQLFFSRYVTLLRIAESKENSGSIMALAIDRIIPQRNKNSKL